MDRVEQIIKEAKESINNYNAFRFKGKNSICSTCKFYKNEGSGFCKKGFSFAGFATKLSDCNNEWEVCNNGREN